MRAPPVQHPTLRAVHAGEFGIQGFPSIKLFSTDKQGKLKSKDYKGERSAPAIVDWALAEAKKVALQRLGVKKGKQQNFCLIKPETEYGGY